MATQMKKFSVRSAIAIGGCVIGAIALSACAARGEGTINGVNYNGTTNQGLAHLDFHVTCVNNTTTGKGELEYSDRSTNPPVRFEAHFVTGGFNGESVPCGSGGVAGVFLIGTYRTEGETAGPRTGQISFIVESPCDNVSDPCPISDRTKTTAVVFVKLTGGPYDGYVNSGQLSNPVTFLP